MCGLTGFWDRGGRRSADEQQQIVREMTGTLHHRGPDDQGIWNDPDCGIALGHTRLSIIDLSPCGHQPMSSACGRYQIVFNGEIYNHHELKRRLPSALQYRGHSDTEVLLAGISHWGLRRTIEQCIGMFAIAVWDAQERTLTLARDRLGIKPLYYGGRGDLFLFGSELKSLRAHRDFSASIDRSAVAAMTRYGYVPAPDSIYESVRKLPPGTLLTVTANAFHGIPPEPFWSLRNVAERGQRDPFRGSFEAAVDQLEQTLADAVRLRMMADVPLGAFLSGGIDSSLVVALMQRQSNRPIKTFTIGFDEAAYNEAHHAREMARHLGTDHTEQIVTPRQAREVIPLLPGMFDEPFGDSSQIPTYLVSALARNHVTVSLSGDGGDELFCGYNRYFHALNFPSLHTWLPEQLRRAGGALATSLSRTIPWPLIRRLLRGGARVLNDEGPDARYIRNLGHWYDEPTLNRGANLPSTLLESPDQWPALTPLQARWMFLDTLTYLPDDILTKVDRASMFVALEARVPLIDHRVVELAWTLPHDFKTDGRHGKRILRALLARYVPTELFERPKTGFGIPIADWLRGPLRDWAEDLLSESRLNHEGYFDPAAVRRKWDEHQSGRCDWHYALWNVLMFQSWLAVHRG